ncbi:MAG: tRNA epoxyqueuosine(34) reductase QueG [Pyrinomonadaceae bacterium]|nr:tRNA epoxyqueuosine(34) reductase QueG [Pyrinomonadaceae bacterium]MBP6213965.1 tRNA epoxyqueuosine(34) reductase QueG [Pyrinomonadaceae bacterium]
MTSLSDQIRTRASEIGFEKVGIAAAVPLTVEGERLDAWLGRGYHGEMAWMEQHLEKRTDPRLLFPGARSVIVVAHNYYTPHEHTAAGKISRYAWGDDYHDVVRDKLKDLLAWIKSVEPAAEGKACVDTAPMMDKAWAVRAGLGWIGKHSNVITTEIGSWIFIGSILLNIELDADTDTVDDHCGTCTACLDACPTGAIVEPYIVDSRKCISYATIELRGDELPREIAENLDGWLYGCDICQDVCPWNRFETPTIETRFEPRLGETSLDPDAVAALTHDEYVERFRRSAMKRAKLGGLKRNAKYIK